MGSRNRQRATFEKRQREMQKKERQAEKRARRQGRETEPAPTPYTPTSGFQVGEYPHEREQARQEATDDADVETESVETESSV